MRRAPPLRQRPSAPGLARNLYHGGEGSGGSPTWARTRDLRINRPDSSTDGLQYPQFYTNRPRIAPRNNLRAPRIGSRGQVSTAVPVLVRTSEQSRCLPLGRSRLPAPAGRPTRTSSSRL